LGGITDRSTIAPVDLRADPPTTQEHCAALIGKMRHNLPILFNCA
jgi:hypothetical protein